jgi:hypothetical protein
LSVPFLACFQVVSNRLWAHTKQEKKNIVLEQGIVKGFEFLLHRKRERIFFERRIFVRKVSGSSFPSEWEAWKRLLQGVVSAQAWKSVPQVFKFQL